LSTEPSIAITQKPIAQPYQNLSGEKATPSPHDPLTQMKGQTATGVVK
jgi:hypothetical protein